MDLTTTYMGVELKNPLIVGGGPTTHTPEICYQAAEAGWAGVVLKTNYSDELMKHMPQIMPRPIFKLMDARGVGNWKPTPPKLSAGRSRQGRKLGTIPPYTVALGNRRGNFPPEYWTGITQLFPGDEKYLYYITETKRRLEGTDCKVIASIIALTKEGWEQECNLINRSPADMVELNFGCPSLGHIDTETGQFEMKCMGEFLGEVEKWTRFCAQRLKIPFGIKLPPSCPDPAGFAQAAARAGAKGVQYTDTPTEGSKPPRPALVINPQTLEPGVFPGIPWSFGQLGPWIFPYTCGAIALMRLNGVGIDISGCGGVREALDVVRLLLAGATSIQVCTATMVEGVGLGDEFLEDIKAWMKKKGFNSIKDFQGKVATKEKLSLDFSKLTPSELPMALSGVLPSQKVVINEKKCIKCGWCLEACPMLAIDFTEKAITIDENLCEICGICIDVCPMKALTIVPR